MTDDAGSPPKNTLGGVLSESWQITISNIESQWHTTLGSMIVDVFSVITLDT